MYIFLPIFIFDFLYNNLDINSQKIYSKLISKSSLVVTIYCIIATMYFLSKSQYVARHLATLDSSSINSLNLPIAIGGGYHIVYGIMLIPIVIAYLFKNSYRRFKIIYAVIYIFIMYFLFKAGFTTAFLISIFGSLLILIEKRNRYIKVMIHLFILIIFIILLDQDKFINIINGICGVFSEDSIIAMRLSEIPKVLYSNDLSNSLGYRVDGLLLSIDTVMKNLFLGVGFNTGFNYFDLNRYLGMHTEWIDSLGKYGLIIYSQYLIFLIWSFKDLIRKYSGSKCNHLIKVLIICVIVLGFNNPFISSSTLMFLFVIIPSILNLKNYNRKRVKGVSNG